MTGLTALESEFVAGFIDGEASFGIWIQNTGTSVTCGMSVVARDDDAQLLEWLAEATGIGILRARPAYRTSRPQVVWSVGALDETLALCELLDAHPLMTRKRLDYAIWRRAVRICAGVVPGDRREVRALRTELMAIRRFGLPARVPTGTLRARPDGGHAYLGGLVTAEACLALTSSASALLSIHMRADDAPILERAARETGLGRVRHHHPLPLNPTVTWTVGAPAGLNALAEAIRPHVRGRKAREFGIWVEGIRALVRRRAGLGFDHSDWMDLVCRLREARAYRDTGWKPPVHGRKRGRRLKCDPLETLRDWAETESGPLSVTRYVAARSQNPHWPSRNTFAKRYGTWHGALEAAGLGDRAASSREIMAARVASSEDGRRRRKQANRDALVAALGTFETTHGRLPHTMTEFFVWTRANAPDAPTQASLYHLFDGGWTGFLVAASEVAVPG